MTLVEVLVAIAILGLAIAGITAGLGTASSASAAHRRTVNADTVVRDYAEAIKQYVRAGNYANCAASGTYKSNLIYTPPTGYDVSQSQPLFQDLSGVLDVVLVMDISSSIAQNSAVGQAKLAANAFLNPLQGTGTRVALVSFGTTAVVQATQTTDVASVMTKITNLTFGPATGTILNPLQYTNWDDGLLKTKGQLSTFPAGSHPLVAIVTDGNPNRWIDDLTGLTFSGSNSIPALTSAQEETKAVQEAVVQANAIKALGSRVFVVGVGTAPALNTANLQLISGPVQYTGAATPPFESSDWMQGSDYATVQSTLGTIAAGLAFEGFTTSGCPPDQGAQTLHLTAFSVDGRDTENLDLIVRRP
jgi:Mg-chelatase subunit ChlD